MKTFLKILVTLAVLFVAFSLGVSWYLGPDDIGRCGTKPTNEKGCQPADAIVAISGGDTAARADEAIRLYHNGWARTIIFSGAAADKSGPSNAQVMSQRAEDAGVPVRVIYTEEVSENTAENASKTRTIFEDRGIRSAILVTSPYHERRALLEFRKRVPGVAFRARPAHADKNWGPLWWLTPSGWGTAMPEFVRSLILSTGGVDQR